MAEATIFRTFSRFSLLLALPLVSGCGGGQTGAKAGGEGDDKYGDSPPAEEGEMVTPEGEEEMTAEEAALLQELDEGGTADPAATTSTAEESGREVVYRVSPEGMKVQIEGAEFVPKAKAVKKGGGWGVELTVEAKTTSDMILWAPDGGPLAFGGFVESGGEKKKFGDKREGGRDVNLSTGVPIKFQRVWPKDGEPALRPGEKLELHVGLWGLGPDAESRKPVRKFVVVKMVASASGAQPLVQPPGQ